MKKWKFFKAMRQQVQKLETVISALKWFGLIGWDMWDEEYVTVKPTGNRETNKSMSLKGIVNFYNDTSDSFTKLEIRENQLEERIAELELKEKAVDDNAKNIKVLVDYFFVDDYFDGEDSAPYSGVKFGNKILKETAVTFNKIDRTTQRFGHLMSLTSLIESNKYEYVQVCYTSGDNALEHKATIARYEKEVATFIKTVKKEK